MEPCWLWPHHSGSSPVLGVAILSCSAQGLAATPSNEACSPDGSVLLTLTPLVSGTTSRPWDWAARCYLSMPPKGSSQQGPDANHGSCWVVSHLCLCTEEPTSTTGAAYLTQFTNSLLCQPQQLSPPVLTASTNGSSKLISQPRDLSPLPSRSTEPRLLV